MEKVEKHFHTIHNYHVRLFVRSKSGSAYTIVAVDGFTMFVLLRAVCKISAGRASLFLVNIAGVFGPPPMVVTVHDGRVQYNVRYVLNHVKNATAMPQEDGTVERYKFIPHDNGCSRKIDRPRRQRLGHSAASCSVGNRQHISLRHKINNLRVVQFPTT